MNLASIQAACLVVRHEEKRTKDEARQLAQGHAQHADVGEAISLVQDFVRLVRQRQPQELETWMACAMLWGTSL